jgi:Domain of unknown function DUF29
MGQKEKNSLMSHLKTLMMHIIKWKSQAEKRSGSWIDSINETRKQIKKLQEEKPSLTDSWIQSVWDDIFGKAKKEAENEMQQKSPIENLSWKEVFVDKYILAEGNWKLWLLLMTLLIVLAWIF